MKPEHPTYQAALFALENNLYLLTRKQLIVQAAYKSTLRLLENIEPALYSKE